MQVVVKSPKIMHKLAAKIANYLINLPNNKLITIWLVGDLGAGKTCFAKGFLASLGYNKVVKSPTYTIVESYKFDAKNLQVNHFDLYRLADPQELEYLGLDNYLASNNICLFEWPKMAKDFLPEPDLIINFEINDNNQRLLELTFLDANQNTDAATNDFYKIFIDF